MMNFEDRLDLLIKGELLLTFEDLKIIQEKLKEFPTDSKCMELYQKISKEQCPFLYKIGDKYKCFWPKETERCIECYEKYPREIKK